MGKHAGQDGFLGDAPVADDANLVDGVGASAPTLRLRSTPATSSMSNARQNA